jgi:16S rRNA (cytosine967-C5)-methyltransferase
MAPDASLLQDPRAVALGVLDRLEKRRLTLDRLMEQALATHPHLDQRDRALVFALVYGVQRWRSRLDHVAATFASRPWHRVDPKVRNILRLALFQILFLDRIPAPAIVHTAVDLAKARAPRAANFVNALLRNVLRQGASAAQVSPPRDPVAALALETAFPSWLAARWAAHDGLETARRRCRAANRMPPLTVRINRLRTGRREVLVDWRTAGMDADPTAICPDGIVIHQSRGPVQHLPGYDAGWFQVQDEAAQLVSLLAAPRPGQRILDACCGRGVKTGHLAALARNRADIVATDQDADKLAELDVEMQRLGIAGIRSLVVDWCRSPAPDVGDGFDLVLLDAPCSGLGVIARNPDAKWRRQPADIDRQARRQVTLMDALAHRVKPAGSLVYAVCSIEPEETDAVVAAFLDRHPDFGIQAPRPFLPVSGHHLVRPDGSLRIDPAVEGMDGFFMVRLQRRSAVGS